MYRRWWKMLRKVTNPNTGEKEYALVSKTTGKVLKYFGKEKPTENEFNAEERRVQYFKNKGK
jgi:hypothetical protein